MMNKILLATVLADALFLGSGILELVYTLVISNHMYSMPTHGKAAIDELLHQRFPITAAIVNASFVLATFVATVPGLIMPSRIFLKIGGYLVTFCAIFTLCVGLVLWGMTLRLKAHFASVYVDQDPAVQSLIQSSFNCCGYFNSSSPAFVTSVTCPSPAASALLQGCGTSIASYSNAYVDTVFTFLFGMVGVDAILVLCIVCLAKDRKERERYRHIDEKSGYRQF